MKRPERSGRRRVPLRAGWSRGWSLVLSGLLSLAVAPWAEAAASTTVADALPQVAAEAGSPVPDTLDGEAYQRIQGRRATVYFVPEQSMLAERVRSLLDDQPSLPALPDSIPFGVHAVLAHTPEALDALTGGLVPEWRAGVAVPSRNLLVIPSGEGTGVVADEGLRTLRHEWAHLGLQQYLEGLRIPRWFSEGYAEWASGGFDAMDVWRLRVGLALGRTPPMDSLALGWPAGREQARTAYLLAASAVTYLLEGSGERGLRIFLDRWRSAGSFEVALRDTYGVTSGQLEEDWRAHVRDRYGWLFVLGHSTIFWLFLGLVLMYMVRVRRARNREKLAQLRADEPPDLPAWWEGGGDEESPEPRSHGGPGERVDPGDPFGG